MRTSLITLCALVLPNAASAQDYEGGLDAHGFVLTAQDGDVRDGFVLHRPGTMEGGQWFAGGVFEFANRPLVLVDSTGDEDVRDPALTNLLGLNLTGGVTVHPRVRLTASMPLFFTSSSFGDSQGAGLGDLRLDAMVGLVRPDEDDLGLGLGLVPWIDLPTGTTSKFLGRDGLGGGGAVAGSYAWSRTTLLANLGVQFDPTVDGLENLTGADGLVTGIGANYLVGERTSVGAELDLLSPFSSNARKGTGSPGETTLSLRHRMESGGFLNAGFAFPVSRGAGAAQYRLFIGGGFGKLGPSAPKDTDMDGLTDDVDACPEQPEKVNGYLDEDGCPDDLSTLSVTVTRDGEPVSGAKLSVTGSDDEALQVDTTDTPYTRPVAPDTTWKLAATYGDCLAGESTAMASEGDSAAKVPLKLAPSATLRMKVVDTSGNPIPNARMAWDSDAPDCLPSDVPAFGTDGAAEVEVGPGKHTLVVSAPNYRIAETTVDVRKGAEEQLVFELAPTKLKLEKSRIVILEKVQFATNKATILPESFELLDEVADIVVRNPDAGRVEVQGHTDSRGSDTYNLDLSQRRAESVRTYLVTKGVDKARLIAVGFGEAKPIAANTTPDGRALNRRVEFLLIDQKSQAIEE